MLLCTDETLGSLKAPTPAPTVAAVAGGAYLGSAAEVPGTIEVERDGIACVCVTYLIRGTGCVKGLAGTGRMQCRCFCLCIFQATPFLCVRAWTEPPFTEYLRDLFGSTLMFDLPYSVAPSTGFYEVPSDSTSTVNLYPGELMISPSLKTMGQSITVRREKLREGKRLIESSAVVAVISLQW